MLIRIGIIKTATGATSEAIIILLLIIYFGITLRVTGRPRQAKPAVGGPVDPRVRRHDGSGGSHIGTRPST
jgi:hypothetical protein